MLASTTTLAITIINFLGAHFFLSHPLRAPLVSKLGENGFLLLYNVVALVTFTMILWAYAAMGARPLWLAPPALVWLSNGVMLVACILMAGSLLTPSPAMPKADGLLQNIQVSGTVRAWTRHPMMLAISLWAVVHVLVAGDLRALMVAIGMLALAAVGAVGQDRRKARVLGPRWAAFARQTSYWPLALQLRGQLPWASLIPSPLVLAAGVGLYALIVWVHP
jgi:uncharacterized membrane protein